MQITKIRSNRGSTKTRSPQSGNGNGITETETETETEYGICERRFEAIDLKKNNSNDNKVNKEIKKDTNE